LIFRRAKETKFNDYNEKKEKKIHDGSLRNSARFTVKKNGSFFGFPFKDKYVFFGNANIGEYGAVARQFETPRCHIDSMWPRRHDTNKRILY